MDGRRPHRISRLESVVLAPSMAISRFGRERAPGSRTKLASAAVVAARVALLVGFAVAGTVFFGLAIAAPIAVPAAVRQGIALSATDLATAHQLGSLWWLFAVGSIASFVGAVATLGNLMRRVGTADPR